MFTNHNVIHIRNKLMYAICWVFFLFISKMQILMVSEGIYMKIDSENKFDSMKVPEFMNTPEKWNASVESIDTSQKFDELSLKILDDDNIDIFEFRDIILKLSADIRDRKPGSGEYITLLADTVVDMLEFLIKKSEEQCMLLMKALAETEGKILKRG